MMSSEELPTLKLELGKEQIVKLITQEKTDILVNISVDASVPADFAVHPGLKEILKFEALEAYKELVRQAIEKIATEENCDRYCDEGLFRLKKELGL